LEKLCGAVGLSLILVFLTAWGLFVLAPGAGAFGAYAISAACAVLGIRAWADLRRLLGAVRVRQALAGFAFLLVWTLIILATIRNYSGAGWAGDWLEQFNRTLFYLLHLPLRTEMFGGYPIPARPPMADVLAAFVMGQTEDRFEIFQIAFTFLNLLVFLPCCLVMPRLARSRRSGIVPLTCIFACSPLLMVNATYPATKAFAAFWLVMATAFYLAGWKKRDAVRMTAAFLALAAGLLAHYSAGPYCVFFALHYLVAIFPSRPEKWKELACIATAGAGLILTWFGWTIASYGLQGTFMAPVNTSVAYGAQSNGGFLLKSLANLVDSIVPHVLRSSSLIHTWDQPNAAGYLRDNLFVIYQTSLIFSMGLIGGPLVVWFLIGWFRRASGEVRNFWLALLGFSVAVCFLVVGERDYYGVAHLTLIPLFALGLTLLAAQFAGWSTRPLAWLIVAGCAVDFSLGVFLQARIEHLENTAGKTVFAGLNFRNGTFDIATPMEGSLSNIAWGNWYRKHQYALSEKWLRELAGFRPNDPAVEPFKAAVLPTIQQAVRDDERFWHGWYRRHGGEVEFFGDHFGSGAATSVVLIVGALGLLWELSRFVPKKPQTPPAPKPPVVPVPVPRSKRKPAR
jgi:hypothetical protein